MLFNSVEFLVFFMVVLVAVAIIKHRKFQHLFLLFASYFFFYFSSNYLIALLIGSTFLDFFIGKKIWETKSQKQKKIFLMFSLAGNLGLLGFFKYADFAILQFNFIGNSINLANEIPLLNLALPIGISFYTFQTLSYTVDIYRGKLVPCKSLSEFALFVSFFPQLVAGPIVRASEFLPQLRDKIGESSAGTKLRQVVIQNSNLKMGITLMAFGFLKKMFFADNIAPLVNDIFTNPVGHESFTIILATLAFGIQIYGDFSGYSDIAIGAALILGFKLPINFNKPYFATSPSDFWRRWHISLSTWLRDYLYIPLGGNRSSKGKTYVNLMTVMLLGGLWHGASWNFVIWGGLHGAYLAIHKVINDKIPWIKSINFLNSTPKKIFAILITQYLVFLTWIPFRVRDLDHAVYAMEKYIFLDFQTSQFISIIDEHKIPVLLMVLFVGLHFVSYKKSNLIEKIANLRLRWWFVVITLITSSIILFFDANPSDFIYFRF